MGDGPKEEGILKVGAYCALRDAFTSVASGADMILVDLPNTLGLFGGNRTGFGEDLEHKINQLSGVDPSEFTENEGLACAVGTLVGVVATVAVPGTAALKAASFAKKSKVVRDLSSRYGAAAKDAALIAKVGVPAAIGGAAFASHVAGKKEGSPTPPTNKR